MAVDLDFEQQLHAAMKPAPAGSLFETFADKALRRVDDVIAGREFTWLPDPNCVQVLQLLRSHQGRGRAVPLHDIAAKTETNQRIIKDIVRELRLCFDVLICSSREGYGYWIAATPEEVKETMQPYLSQALSELRLYRAMTHQAETLDETMSQIRLALTTGDAHV